MRPQKMEINPGDRFGMLTVLCEKEKAKQDTGSMRYGAIAENNILC